jgi:hypothetical protein
MKKNKTIIGKILCYFGFHDYVRNDYFLTSSVMTTVKCKRCDKELKSSDFLDKEEVEKRFDKCFKKDKCLKKWELKLDKYSKKMEKK